jgi:hypothetical protein
MAENLEKLIFGGLHEKHAVQRGIWVPTQHLLLGPRASWEGYIRAKNFEKLIFGGLHEKHAVQRGIWVPTQHLLLGPRALHLLPAGGGVVSRSRLWETPSPDSETHFRSVMFRDEYNAEPFRRASQIPINQRLRREHVECLMLLTWALSRRAERWDKLTE